MSRSSLRYSVRKRIQGTSQIALVNVRIRVLLPYTPEYIIVPDIFVVRFKLSEGTTYLVAI